MLEKEWVDTCILTTTVHAKHSSHYSASTKHIAPLKSFHYVRKC